MSDFSQAAVFQGVMLMAATAVVVLGYRVASRHDVFNLDFPSPWQVWQTQKLIRQITQQVLLLGDQTDGPLKGHVPCWLAGFNHVSRGKGTFEVLVRSQEQYFIVTFSVERWKPTYRDAEGYSRENALKLMELHLQALGRWSPLKTVD